ncbi:MAG TPA: tetratricopeptide repeat protein [Bryobacteraceae bacterium]|nr:tetratricopeptide repeat protein [Bryobacteraceae bacterium]
MRHRSGLVWFASAALLVALGAAGCRRSPQAQAELYMAGGIRRAAAGDYSRAMLEFRNAAKHAPRDARPYYRLALCYLELDDPAGTIVSLQRALQLNPDYLEAQLKTAELLVATRRPEALRMAVEKLNQILSRHPGEPAALQMRAQAELASGNLDDAEKTLSQLPGGGRQGDAGRLRALLLMARKDFAGAEALLKQEAQSRPDSVPAAIALGRLYRILGRAEDAGTQFRRVLRAHDTEPQALLELAAMRIEAGRRNEARPYFEKLGALPQPRYKLALVRFLAETGRHAEAMEKLEQLYRDFPRDRAVRTTLVRSYVAQGRGSEARQILDRALEASRSDADALVQRAGLHLKEGRLRQANDDLMNLLRNRPESAEGHYLLAQVYRERGLPALEKQELYEALRLEKALLPARIELAQLLLRGKAAREALELMNAAPEAQKNAVAAVVERNWVLLALGERGAAREGIDRALAGTETADLSLQDGLLKLAEGHPSAARARLEPALRRWPDDVRFLDALAATFRLENKEAQALELVRSYARAKPGSAVLQEYAGQYLASSGDVAGARAAFRTAVAAGGKWKPAATIELARLAAREGDSASARELLAGVLASDSGNAAARRMLAMVEQSAGNSSQALAQYQRLVEMDDHDPVVLNNFAWLLSEHARQLDLALKYAQRARELASESAPAIDDTLGRIYYQKGLYRTAIEHFENGLKKERTAQRTYHLAQAYLKSGQEGRAQRIYSTALKLDPSLPVLQ